MMPLESLMLQQDRHFGRILDLIRSDDVKDRFRKMRHEALALAEMANINGYHERSRSHADYRQWAAQLKEQAVRLGDLAAAQNIAEAKQLTKQVNNTCKACHDKYHE